ncbi:thrombomodulin-like [Tachypleus tridentatus]|uniref:thrombomodulin-like n=1 Tax=Tachypleus tridentatus TaxID=6853 RepID=UPI003FCF9827
MKICQNILGSYQYTCNSGFFITPEDEDDCHTIPGLCLNGCCVNAIGSFLCNCQDGYELRLDKCNCIGDQ